MSRRYRSSEITRQAMGGALKRLMAVKPLEKITVAEIMDTCGMRRQHFYYYFSDIYDLMHWMFQEEALELLRQQEGGAALAGGVFAALPVHQPQPGGMPVRAGLFGAGRPQAAF